MEDEEIHESNGWVREHERGHGQGEVVPSYSSSSSLSPSPFNVAEPQSQSQSQVQGQGQDRSEGPSLMSRAEFNEWMSRVEESDNRGNSGWSSRRLPQAQSEQWHNDENTSSPRRLSRQSSSSSFRPQRESPQRQQQHTPQRRQSQSSLSLSPPDSRLNEQQQYLPFDSTDANTYPDAYLSEEMSDRLSAPPFWLSLFRPRITGSLTGSNQLDSPIPQAQNFAHAGEIRNALTSIHLAVALANEEAGEDDEKRIELLRIAVWNWMPVLQGLGVVSSRWRR